MKRLLIAIPVTVAVAAAVAGLSGAFSSGHGVRAVGAASGMPMPMPTASASAPEALRVELHQRVVRVKIMNFAFLPARVEVSPGTRVVWTNQDSDPHTVTTDQPGFSSQALDTGQTYAAVLTKAGTFAYHCTIHPFMHGTVVVEG
jgi:plastocyanin